MAKMEQLHAMLARSLASTLEDRSIDIVNQARDLLHERPVVQLDTTNEEVRVFLAGHPDLEVVAVVNEQNRPIGLINRFIFAEAYAHPFAREVYGKRSCIAWMDKDPLVLDEETGIEALIKAALAKGPRVLKDGFIGTRDGRYIGQGTGFALMKAMEALETERSRQVMESIEYASTIQRSHLRTSNLHLAETLKDYALHWAPRDVVGGDCYFFRRTQAGLFGAIVDCTGHGVPGAFMSLITLSFLGFLIGDGQERVGPGQALTLLNQHIKAVLSQAQAPEMEAWEADSLRVSDDGLDAACFLLAPDGTRLVFAGARMPMFLVNEDPEESRIIEAERMGVGYVGTPDDHLWLEQDVSLPCGSRVVIPTDGITDQVGGPNGLSLGRRRLMEWLIGTRTLSAEAIGQRFLDLLGAWQGEQVRRDDATFLVFTP
ncbi:SpoIIE family protein phosphatase [Geothrix sp. 21YS21S-2]|uniref:SpoIIE family protein phosphatase n=1 Tax=Geothrix sp. 21YS21S-2 TaxID=3068893 RepID=UPI0027B8B951|nr:SpoIIE family protein phosphatase [Geothrix sp. 21YS21S-2]